MDERRETHDFMNVNVESFSQLPFIRRTPSKEKTSIIRLFGQELGGDNNSDNNLPPDSSETITKNEETSENVKDKEKDHKDNSNRRFECHYCFRNFPTSQALGGHQNAHKRERQHIKRGSMTSYLHQTDHVYGYLNHHRQYPSWTSEARFYGGQQTPSYYSRTTSLPSNPPTINGSPLWRVQSSSTSANAIHHQGIYSSASPASTFRMHEDQPNWPYNRLRKANVQQDNVSLDLHL